MTDHVARLYAGALALLAFFLVWAVIAARPWAAADEPDPRMQRSSAASCASSARRSA